MILNAKPALIDLMYREVMPIADAAGTKIGCMHGRLWITEHRGTDDVVLETGGSHVISRDGLTVVQALRDSRLVLLALRERQIGPPTR